jgi:hypothetical protein
MTKEVSSDPGWSQGVGISPAHEDMEMSVDIAVSEETGGLALL